uniref:MCF.2 cell line derived transforming sequence n=1 Tax=Nothobranchius furzeri TaxID=105023 RepID=A0A8C6KFG9_NOTFU
LIPLQAIESFAVTVKDIAQMLQGFGTEVAETELPDEGKAIEHLLEIHTEKYRKLKVKLHARCITIHYWADVVFCCKNILCMTGHMESAFDGFFEKHHLKLHQHLQLLRYEQSFQEMDLCLEHLMGQEKELSLNVNTLAQAEVALKKLDCLESNSQEVMSRAQIIILHGHQLSAGHHYALALIMQRCNELRHRCDSLSAALKTKHSFLMQTHQLLLCLGQAQTWCDDGAYMLANQLVDKSQSKEGAQVALREIEKFLEVAPSMLSSSLEVLSMEYEAVITPQLQHAAVQQMIQNRQACLRKLADKHVRPVQLVTPRPDNTPRSKSPLFSPKHSTTHTHAQECELNFSCIQIEVIHDYQESRSCVSYSLDGDDSPDLLKRHVMRELIETERIYVDELLSVLLGYRAEMDNPVLSGLLPPILRSKRDLLFGNMPEIYNFHSRVFLQDLEGCLEAPETVGACFLERKENFQMYEWYCQNKPRSEALWRQFSDCAFFHECQTKLEHKLGLDSYLLKPVQRLTKYQLLLKELLKYSPDCEGTSELQGALTAMLDLLKSVNDSMHQISITGYEGDICALGRVLMQGSFSVWISHKRGPTRMKELARFKPMQRHFFLYEKALLLCKRREEHGEGNNKTPSYSFKHCLKMTAVGITENVKGDVKKFEVWYSGREEVYVVQAPTVEVKMAWLNELRRILTNQQKLLRGRYRALADCSQNGPNSISIKSGDVIHLQFEDNRGRWLVKNQSRQQEGFVPTPSLQIIIGNSSQEHSPKLGGKGRLRTPALTHPFEFLIKSLCVTLADPTNLRVRKLSSP